MSDTNALIEAVKNEHGSAFENCRGCTYGTHNEEVITKLTHLAELEAKLESGELKERAVGKWVDDSSKLAGIKCNVCNREPLYWRKRESEKAVLTLTEYCPWCGARLYISDDDIDEE